MPKRPPNILFVMPDEWRPGAFGFAGNPVIQTPNIDALARRGAWFRASYCESPVCQPSRASLVTGRFPRDHRLYDNSFRQWAEGNEFPNPRRFQTFMHRLQQAGYYTAEIGKMHFGSPEDGGDAPFGAPGCDIRSNAGWINAHGFHESYEEVDKYGLLDCESGYTSYLKERGLLDMFREHLRGSMELPGAAGGALAARPEPLDPEDTLDAYIGQRACQFIRRYTGDNPFFLWVTPIGPHMPFDAPRYWSDRYDPARIGRGPAAGPEIPDNRWGDYVRWHLDGFTCTNWSSEEWGLIAQLYYGLCSQVDHQMGQLVRALDEAGFSDNTWIFFSSDHGELLGDHNLIGKRFFYRSSVRVPSLIVPPGGTPAPIVVDRPIQNMDLIATMLEVAGAEADGYDGRSLLAAFDGKDVGREAAFSEIAEFTSVMTDRHTLICHRETLVPQALYDRDVDPDEVVDVLTDGSAASVVEHIVETHLRPFAAGRR